MINEYRPNETVIKKEKEPLKYHYTSPEGLLSILENGCLHFTDIGYCNDKAEKIFVVKCRKRGVKYANNHSTIAKRKR